MKNQGISIKNKIIPKYFNEDNSKKKSSTSDINVLLNRIELNKKNESKLCL